MFTLLLWCNVYLLILYPDADLPSFNMFNPLTAKLFNLNFHPLGVVSRWRDPQLKMR